MQSWRFIGLVAIGMASATSTVAQDTPDRPTIAVQGRGTAERPADTFMITGEINGRGADQVSALSALAEVQSRVSNGLTRLDGLTAATLRTDSVHVEPVFASDCAPAQNRRSVPACPITGYAAAMGIVFKGAPVTRAGDAVSLAAELGAERAASSVREVEDEAALKAEAARLAFLDARSQAETLAVASGRRLGRLVRIQDPAARSVDRDSSEPEQVVVTGSRMMPSVAVPVEFPPVRATAQVNVLFELE